MKPFFADSFYFLALLNPADPAHDRANQISLRTKFVIVTTLWVLAEVADALSSSRWRRKTGAFLAKLETSSWVAIRGESDALFARGLDLYCRRPDKAWSLTDCISFTVMAQEGLSEALTGDHHFEQAGFVALLAG